MTKTGSNILVFYVNGKKVVDDNVNPEWTLLYYLRTKLRLCGTKLSCGEGGCGACTVMLSKYDRRLDQIRHIPINACLAPICSVHGKAITTVEGIGSTKTKLHPAQERIAKAHGSQCGYCTPGFVMSMYTLLRNNPKPSMADLEVAFQGNLCRCTGYRPIMEGYKTFTEEWEKIQNGQQLNGNGCAMGDKCCKLQNGKNTDEVLFKSNEFTPYDDTSEPIFPPELMLNNDYDSQFLTFKSEEVTWYRPTNLKHLLELKEQFPEAKLVCGNTEVGVEVKFKNTTYPVLIQPTIIPELVEISSNDQEIKIGAAVTLADLDTFARKQIKTLPEHKTRILKGITEIFMLFAGQQVRSVGSIGGNIMTGSPISDFIPILMAVKANLEVISKSRGKRIVKIDDKFFTGYRKNIIEPDEILLSISIPYSKEDQYFCAYKQAKRRDDDIAIVNLAVNVVFRPKTHVIQDINLAFGGMSFKTVSAPKTEKSLLGLTWDRNMLDVAFAALLDDLPLEASAPGGMVTYRKSLSLSLFFRAFLAITENLQKYIPDITIDKRELSAVKNFTPKEFKSSQYFTVLPESGERVDGLQQPIVHNSAYKQASGEAIYVDDMPIFENELQLAFVISTRAHAKILNIDASEALKMEGVVAFLSAKDLPPHKNVFGWAKDEKIFYDDIVTSEGQVIGVIVANDRYLAKKAAKKVKIDYEDLEPVIVTLQDAINKNSFFANPYKVIKHGDLDKVWKEADHILEGQVEIGGQEHFYMETQSVAVVPGEDNELTIYSSIQTLRELAVSISEFTDIPQHKIYSKNRRVGGGFGGKESKGMLFALPSVLAARKFNRPVRCMLDRDEDMMMTGGRNPFLIKYKVAFSKDGKLLGLEAHLYINCGHSRDYSLIVTERAMTHIHNSYNIPTLHVYTYGCKTNTRSNTAFRGFGAPQAMFACETMIHHIASFLKMNPEEIREKNLSKEGDLLHYNQKLINFHLERCWKECIENAKFYERKKAVETFNKENKYRKRGIVVVPTNFGIGFPFNFLNQGAALVLVYTDGSVLLSHGGIEMGQGVHTKLIQVASRVLQLPVERIHTLEVSTDKIPNFTTTAGSLGSDYNGMAVVDACTTIMERLKPYREQNPQGKWEEWVQQAYFDRVNLSATGFFKAPDLGYNWETNTGMLHNYFTYGAACTEVEIDTLTGDHQVLRVDIVMDLGQSLNPAIDIGQIEGGFMQGYGLTALEELVYSPKGVSYTRGPGTYKLPSFSNIPGEFNVSLLKGTSNPRAVFSSKGVGEPPLFLGASVVFAIRQAINAAREENGLEGFVPLHSPVSPAKIRLACQDQITQMIKEPPKDSYVPWNAYETKY